MTHGLDGWKPRAELAQDLRLGARLLGRSRAFALFSVLSLALGIGAICAVFSLFHSIVLRVLPVPDAERLVVLSFTLSGGPPNSNLPYPHFARMRSDNRTLDGLFAWTDIPRVSVGFGGRSEPASAAGVTGDYYGTLRLKPALGRLLTADDDQPGHAAVAVLSHGYWQRRFGGSAAVLEQGILVNQVPFRVVGVEPARFAGVTVGSPAEVSVPIRARDLLDERPVPWSDPFATWIEVMGRLKPGTTLDQATQDLNLIFRRVNDDAAAAQAANSFAARVAKEAHLRVDAGARGGFSGLRNGYEHWLRLLLALLGAVHVLACLNVATLLLSRSETRRQEIATRLALGAGRWRIVRQLLTETGLVAALGGGLGVWLAWGGSRALLRLATASSSTLPVDLTPDVRVVGFTVAVAALSCLLVGILPALRSSSLAPGAPVREIGGPKSRLLDRTLVASQVALSLVLLVCAGLFLRSLASLWRADAGYDRRSVLMFSVDAHLAGRRGADVPASYWRLFEQLELVPGAASVAVSSVRPVSDSYYLVGTVTQVGARTLPDGEPIRIAYNNVSPGYFRTLALPLVSGRDFDRRDDADSPPVAIVSEKLARHFVGDPVGQRVRLGKSDLREVVGVARDSRYANVRDAPREVVYLPLWQARPDGFWFAPSFEIRYAGPLPEILGRVRESVDRVDPQLVPFRVKTLEAQTQESLVRERLLALLTSFFGGFALLLACIGLYGLMACTVARRTSELSLRMALGASPARICRTVMAESVSTVTIGALAGLLAALGVARHLASQVHGLDPRDLRVLAGSTATLLVLVSLASYLPAHRASRIEPTTALRQE